MIFLHELAVRLTAAVAAQEVPDIENYLEQQTGEEVVGYISDPQLLALIAIRDAWDAELLLSSRLKSSWQKIALAGPARAINQALLLELQRTFVGWEDVPLGIRRKGHDFIVVKFRKRRPILLRVFSTESLAERSLCRSSPVSLVHRYTKSERQPCLATEPPRARMLRGIFIYEKLDNLCK